MYIWLVTTFGTVQKWSLRPLLDSLKGGLIIGIFTVFSLNPVYRDLAVDPKFSTGKKNLELKFMCVVVFTYFSKTLNPVLIFQAYPDV